MKVISIITVICLLVPLVVFAQLKEDWQAVIVKKGELQQGGSFELTIKISEPVVVKKEWTETLAVDAGTYKTKADVQQLIKKRIEYYKEQYSLWNQVKENEVIKLTAVTPSKAKAVK
jgi:hypothetical protein